jgi:F-type H+-transporting ATPase subunit a
MPDHSTWLSFLLGMFQKNLEHNAHLLGRSFVQGVEPTWQSWEPLAASLFVILMVIGIAAYVRSQVTTKDSVLPETRLTLRTFLEIFLEYFYEMARSVMDADRAKKYFPLIGGSATFIFFSNLLALIPGMPVPTSNLNITLGCALVVFIMFNLYGIKEQGFGYVKHLAGPVWYMAPLILPIEVISLIVRPVTLAVRLMLNMAVDHLILSIFVGMVALFIPLPIMLLGVLVLVVQTLVFTLLTCIYIGLATEHEAH